MIFRVFAASLFVFVFACSSAEERAETAQREVAQAVARGDRQAASLALEKLRQNPPKTVEDLVRLTGLMVQAGEAAHAFWLLEEGLERFPDREDLRIFTAQAALNVREGKRAMEVLEPIGPESKYHAEALLLRSRGTLVQGDLPGALAILEQVETLYPERRKEARLIRINTLMSEERYDEALALTDEARSELGPEDDSFELDKVAAQLYNATKQPEKTIALLEPAVDEDPTRVKAWQLLLTAYLQTNRLEDGRTRIKGYIEELPDEPVLYGLLAEIETRLGNRDAAEAALLEMNELAPSVSSYLDLARFYLTNDQRDKIEPLLDEAMAKFPDDAMLRFGQFELMLGAGRLDEAEAALAAFEERSDDPPWNDYLTARLEFQRGDTASARARLEKVVAERDNAETQFWLGRVLEAEGDETGALRRYRLAVTRDGSMREAYVGIIRIGRGRGDWATVYAAGQWLVAVAPDMPEAWGAMVQGLLMLGDAKSAGPIAERFVLRFPKNAGARVMYVRALRDMGKVKEAEVAIEDAVERLGSDPELEAEHALLLGVTGRLDEGIAMAEASSARYPDNARVLLALAGLRFQKGDTAGGSEAVDRALALAPDDPTPLQLRLQYLASRGQLEPALADGERYLVARPDDPAVLSIVGMLYARSGNPERAIESLRRAAELDASAFEPRNNVALILDSQGDLDGALEMAQQAYALAPDNPYVLDTLGWLYVRKGLVERSIPILESAHTSAPGMPDAQLHLALAYREAGRKDEARQLLVALVERTDEQNEIRSEAQEALRSLN